MNAAKYTVTLHKTLHSHNQLVEGHWNRLIAAKFKLSCFSLKLTKRYMYPIAGNYKCMYPNTGNFKYMYTTHAGNYKYMYPIVGNYN